MRAPETTALPAQSFFKGVWDYLCSDTGGAAVVLALLVVALAAFLLSTKQWPLRQRALIWGLGVALLGLSAFMWKHEFERIKKAVSDANALFRDDRLVVAAFGENFAVIQDYIILLFGAYFVFAAAVGMVALIAFTPGEAVERALRPFGILILGGIFGSAAALFLVVIGTANYPKRHFFWGTIDTVTDGDTFVMGGLKFRPAGADAPEEDQKCLENGELVECGKSAAAYLREIADGKRVACVHIFGKRDAFGRELAQCKFIDGDEKGWDIAELLVKKGHAISYGKEFRQQQDEARKAGEGIWAGCFHNPKAWRDAKSQERKKGLADALKMGDRTNVLCGPIAS